MTWGSERSGIASSGVLITAYTPAAMAKTVTMRTIRMFRLDQRIIPAIIGQSPARAHFDRVRTCSWFWRDDVRSDLRLASAAGIRRRERLQSRLQIALGVDQEVRAHDHLLVCGKPVADFVEAIGVSAELHLAGVECPFAWLHEDDLPCAAVDDRRILNRQDRTATQ